MRILLTFDVEVWCNTWQRLDEAFPAAFERYVYGRSKAGEYALPKTLQILKRHGLRAVFFVEPLFAARFGVRHLRTIVSMIQEFGQDVQLHLHPEWCDEIRPAPLPGNRGKRQHLRYYSAREQATLIALGQQLLRESGAPRVVAFRAGSFAANADTFRALAMCGIRYDSSIDPTAADSVPDLRGSMDLTGARCIEGVRCYPVSAFVDGRGALRHAQVGACSAQELVHAIEAADRLRWQQFVLYSHNFEMLKRDSRQPDWIVVHRFERLCEHLARQQHRYPTATFDELDGPQPQPPPVPRVGLGPTLRRHAEQALRRLY